MAFRTLIVSLTKLFQRMQAIFIPQYFWVLKLPILGQNGVENTGCKDLAPNQQILILKVCSL